MLPMSLRWLRNSASDFRYELTALLEYLGVIAGFDMFGPIYYYQCLPTALANHLVAARAAKSMAHICSPIEPIIRGGAGHVASYKRGVSVTSITPMLTAPEASTIFSSTVKNDLVLFEHGQRTVDRSAKQFTLYYLLNSSLSV